MIIENTVDLARLKLDIPKFLKWLVKNFHTYPFMYVTDKDTKRNFPVSDVFQKFLQERGVKNISISGFGTCGVISLSGFLIKNYPNYMSIAINPMSIETTIRVTIDGVSSTPASIKLMPFKYGLELHPMHKGDIDIFRIEKDTTLIKAVRYNPKISVRKISYFGDDYTLERFLKYDSETKGSDFRHIASKATSGYSFNSPSVYVEKINFTEVLPIEKDLMMMI